jgi:hypothetical protein
MRNKAERRHSENVAKEAAKHVMKHVWKLKNLTPKNVGRNASVHNRMCACYMCQGSNRETNSWRDKTLQEIRADETMKESNEQTSNDD